MSQLMVSFPQKLPEGESGMITRDTWGMIKALHRQGWSQRKIARELDVDPKTVHRTLHQETRPTYRRRVTAGLLLAGYEEFMRHRVVEVDYNAHRIFQELRTQGYRGGYDTVKLFVRPLRAERDRLIKATLRFETAPGRQAQVDWGSTWAQIGERRTRVQLFVMVLGYSRRLYAEFTPDQTLASLLRCHEHAFDWFGGLTEEILLTATSPTYGAVTVVIVDTPGKERDYLLSRPTSMTAPRLIRAWRQRGGIEHTFRTLKHLLATEACQMQTEDAYYGHLVLRLLAGLVLLYTARVLCKGQVTMEELVFCLTHHWRFLESEMLE